jgi:hypothetical protein
MFIQVIEGKVADAEGVRRQMDRWMAELRPGATGWLGTTAGVTADGWSISLARFESAAAARANSTRPEQGAWWAETEKCFAGPVSFAESEDVEMFLGGGTDDAGFVQIMKGHGIDRAAVAEMDRVFEPISTQVRPDVLGLTRVWLGPDSYVEAVYFTSEADARAGETAEMPAEVQATMEKFGELMSGLEYFDLTDPQLHSP